MTRPTFLKTNAPALAFILLALVGGFAIKSSADSSTEKLYQTQLEGCERGNKFRTVVGINVEVLDEFINQAAAARDASGDTGVAEQYRDLSARTDAVAPVDCKKVIKKP